MNYSQIRQYDVANGTGIGCTIFFSGCRLRCKGCFQPETWSFKHGNEFTREREDDFIKMCNNTFVDHVSLLGGDFMQQDYKEALNFIKRLRSEVGKPIWVWTGLTLEEMNRDQRNLLRFIDIVIDGRYIEELKDLRLRFKGSSNQRIIDVQETLRENKIILHKLN